MTTTELQAKPVPRVVTPEGARYQRTVITTGRKKEEPKPAEYTFSQTEVKALSKDRGDADWYARRRLAAWKTYHTIPFPTLNDEAWRRTDIRPFKWNEIVLPHLQSASARAGRVP